MDLKVSLLELRFTGSLVKTFNTSAPAPCSSQSIIKIFYLQVCDGINQCGNRLDESKCEALGYEVRLTGDNEGKHMGRVEVKSKYKTIETKRYK